MSAGLSPDGVARPAPALAEPAADLVRLALLAAWVGPLAVAVLGPARGGSAGPIAAVAAAVAAYLAGIAFLRPALVSGRETAQERPRTPAPPSRRGRRAAVAAAAAAALVATFAALGPTGVADALAEAGSFFAGGPWGAAARQVLAALALAWAAAFAGLAAGRTPTSAERAAADWRTGAAGWLAACVALDLRGAEGRPLYAALSLAALAFVALAIAAVAISRYVEAAREAGGDPRLSRRSWLLAAGGAGAAFALLSLASLLLAPEALGLLLAWLARAWSLLAEVIAFAALPLGYLAGLVLLLVRSHVGARTPSEPTPLRPGFASEAGPTVSLHPLVVGGARAALALAALAALVWLAARLLRTTLDEVPPAAPGEVRARIEPARPLRRAEPSFAPRLPGTPARRAFWRVKRALVEAGYPAGESAQAFLRRAARLAAEGAGAGAGRGDAEAAAREAASFAETLLLAYWPERYAGIAEAPPAAARAAKGPPAAGSPGEVAALERAARHLVRAVEAASHEGRTPRVRL